MGKQLDSIVEAVGTEDDVPFLPGQYKEEDNEHDDRALGQLACPRQNLVPVLGTIDQPFYGLFMEGGKFIFGIVRKHLLDPEQRMFLQIGQPLLPLLVGHIQIDRRILADGLQVGVPIFECLLVYGFKWFHLSLSFIYASK